MDLFDRTTEVKIAGELLQKTSRGESISDELNAIPYQDRLQIAQQMATISRLQDPKNLLPDLTVQSSFDKNDNEHLVNIIVEGPKPIDVYNLSTEDKKLPAGFGRLAADQQLDGELQIRAEKILAAKGRNLPQMELYEALVKEQKAKSK
jgi:hypothetical protein